MFTHTREDQPNSGCFTISTIRLSSQVTKAPKFQMLFFGLRWGKIVSEKKSTLVVYFNNNRERLLFLKNNFFAFSCCMLPEDVVKPWDGSKIFIQRVNVKSNITKHHFQLKCFMFNKSKHCAFISTSCLLLIPRGLSANQLETIPHRAFHTVTDPRHWTSFPGILWV